MKLNDETKQKLKEAETELIKIIDDYHEKTVNSEKFKQETGEDKKD